MLLWNAIGAVCIIGWHTVMAIILFLSLKFLGLFRIASKLEISGLDKPYHNEPAYDLKGGDTENPSVRILRIINAADSRNIIANTNDQNFITNEAPREDTESPNSTSRWEQKGYYHN